MKRKDFVFFIFIILCFSCKHREYKIIPDNYIPQYSSEQLKERIGEYYKSDFTDSLMNFLLEWNTQVPSSTKEYIDQNDTLKNIFLVFADLYKPFKFGDYNAIKYFEDKNKYVVIQNEINYAVISTSEYQCLVFKSSDVYPNDTAYEFYRKTKKLLYFRPQLNFARAKCLYLTNEYKRAINDFLGLGSFNGDIIKNSPIFSRYKFLCPTLPIVYGHWGGYWHIETFPIIDRIIFDKNFKHASVDFRYSLEETVLQYRITKKAGHWRADNKWLKIRLE